MKAAVIIFLMLFFAFSAFLTSALCAGSSAWKSEEERFYDDLEQEAALREYLEGKEQKKEGKKRRRPLS